MKKRRRGVILISVFICLMTIVLVATSLMRSAALCRRQLRSEAQATQAHWLVKSGLRRAVRKLKAQPKYVGEVWKIKDPSLPGDATVTISLSAPSAGKAKVTVTAHYPNHKTNRAAERHSWIIKVPSRDKP